MKHHLINTALFCGIVAAMFGIQLVDDRGYEHQVAREELAKQQRQERLLEVAKDVCGPGSGYRLTEGKNEIVCLTRRTGRTTKTAQL